MARPAHTWRKGLRWIVGSGWTVVKTGRLLTATGLQRKKTAWRKKFDIAKPAKRKKPRARKPAKRKKPRARKPARPKKPKKPEIAYDTPGYVADRVTDQLKRAVQHLKSEGFTSDQRVSHNKDGTVDAELRVRPDTDSEGIDSVVQILLAMEEYTTGIKAGKTDTWVSAGVRFKPIEKEMFYIRFMGMSQANTNYSRNKGEFRATNLVGARTIAQNWMQKRKDMGEGREPEQVILRIHWNKNNKQPTRKGKKRGE